MIRIAALNNASSDESNSDDEVQESTKEAQEAEAFALYNKALSLQRAGKLEEAQDVYQKLLQSTLIIKESAGTITTGEGVVRPGLILKYSAMKNLASLASEKHDLHTAMKYYLKAVELDCSDVTVWYHMGKIAVELSQLSLARLAFEEALTCNPNHWPAMDSLCSVLYALSDYYSCMYYISKALGRDGSYTKGLVLRDKMYQEQPSLKRECEPLFQSNEFTNYDQKYSKDEADKIVNEAVDIRNKRKEQIKPPEIPVLKFEKPLTSLTWKCLGERLVSLYDLVDSKKPTLSFGHHVDLSYQVTDTQIDTVIDLSMDTSTPMDITASASVQPVEQTVSTCTSSITSTVASATSITSTTTMTKTTNITSTPIPSPSRQQDHRQGKQKEEEPMETEIDSSSGTEKSKRGPKRKRGVVASDDTPAAKRRSQRVRNTTKKKEEAINYKELLRQFLPSSLRESEDEDEDDDNKVTDSNNTLELIREHEAASCTTPGSKKQDSTAFIMTEENDVTAFLDKYSNNNGIVDLMIQYCIALAQRCNSKWPGGLTGVYIEVYKKLRVHLSLPSYYCKSVNNQRIKEVSLVSLVYTELQLEKWLATKLMSPVSPNTMQSNLSADKSQLLLPSDPDDVFPSDLQYLEGLCHLKDILNDSRLQFAIRVYWLKSRYLMLQGKMESALDCFDICSQLLKPEKAESLPVVPVVVRLPNCKDDIITSEQVKKQLESLQRCQSLEEVHRLSEMGDYRKVVDLLLPTLSQPATKGKMMDVGKTIPERPAQLLLLLDALYQIQNYTLCVSCSVNTLNECIQQLTSSSTMTIKENWVATLTKVLKFVDKCISGSGDIISGMSRTKIVNLTNHVIRMIELAMESTDSPELPVISTIVPWVLLYRLIKHEEDQLTLIQVSEQGSTDEMGAGSGSSKDIKIMPSSLMLLYTAHEYLGRRGWCCNSDGNLLTFYVDTLQEELGKREEKDPLRQDLLLALEQCFYCLYGHPNRKAKARHLQDHGVEEVILTWDKAVFVFDYFKPKTVPEFDSYKTSSMSGELENLLLKISKVIPNPDNIAISLDTVMAYIEGTADQVPTIPQDKPVSLPVVKELYYLLADYYFKNKEWGKAIKFYMHDICVRPDRFDSWAGMALARSSRLEAKLSSCDVKNESAMQKNAAAALRCFQRALEIDPSNYTLWIEYGSLAYALHSHSSRQLKQQKTQVSMTTEMMQTLKSKREEMLELARKCFGKAKDCEGDGEEEEWLIHYMLGKIAEKQRRPPQVYLEHYKQAANHLYEDDASYPRKIHYHNPPDLAMEALEVHFRLHASVIKLLGDSDAVSVDYKILEDYILEATGGPFAKGQQKEVESISTSSPSSQDIPRPTFTATPIDHDYTLTHSASKQKNDQTTKPKMNQDTNKPTELQTTVQETENVQPVFSEIKMTLCEDTKVLPTTALVTEDDTADKDKITKAKEEDKMDKDGKTDTKDDCKETTEKEKKLKVVNLCLDALKLCLSRFPQHYKSLYRMAKIYLYSSTHENIQWSRDLLLGTGNIPWHHCSHMPAQGLFAERNKSNFFNGIWRIPVDEIDRPGSFPSHMHRSIILLLEVLLKMKDYKVLFLVSSQLQRTPDQGKKYLRDVDRVLLAKLAYDYALQVLEGQIEHMKEKENDGELFQLLLASYKVWQYGSSKLQTQMDSANKLLSTAYRTYRESEVEEGIPILEQAIRFCNQHSNIHKQPQTPTHGESMFWPSMSTKSSSLLSKEDAETPTQRKSDIQPSGSDVKESSKRPESLEKSDTFVEGATVKEMSRHSEDSNSLNEVQNIVSNVDIPGTLASTLQSDLVTRPFSLTASTGSSPLFKSKTPHRSVSKSPPRAGARSPTRLFTKSPTRGVTKSPTRLFTKSPTRTGAKSPTTGVVKSPTRGATKSPTRIFTKSPTRVTPKSPTRGLTKSPTRVIPKSPTGVGSKSPLRADMKSPPSTGSFSPPSSTFSFQKCFEQSLLHSSSSSKSPIGKLLPSKSPTIDEPKRSTPSEEQKAAPSSESYHGRSSGFAGLSMEQLTDIADSRDFGTMVSRLVESLVTQKSQDDNSDDIVTSIYNQSSEGTSVPIATTSGCQPETSVPTATTSYGQPSNETSVAMATASYGQPSSGTSVTKATASYGQPSSGTSVPIVTTSYGQPGSGTSVPIVTTTSGQHIDDATSILTATSYGQHRDRSGVGEVQPTPSHQPSILGFDTTFDSLLTSHLLGFAPTEGVSKESDSDEGYMK